MTTPLLAEVPVLMSFGGQLDGKCAAALAILPVTQRFSCPPEMSQSSHSPSGPALRRESKSAAALPTGPCVRAAAVIDQGGDQLVLLTDTFPEGGMGKLQSGSL